MAQADKQSDAPSTSTDDALRALVRLLARQAARAGWPVSAIPPRPTASRRHSRTPAERGKPDDDDPLEQDKTPAQAPDHR